MMTQVKAYVSWEAEPAKAPRSGDIAGTTRRRRPSASYSRDHEWLLGDGGRVEMTDRIDVPERCRSLMRGTPEEAFIAAISSSHMLAFLAITAEYHVPVVSYLDKPTGVLVEDDDGLRLVEVLLRPDVKFGEVTVSPEAEEKLHEEAQRRSMLGNCTTAKVAVFPEAVYKMDLTR
jgi:organic hydroperoxide reductase OsmC/OhrA